MSEHIVPFADLSRRDVANLDPVNWVAIRQDGFRIPNWERVEDSNFGTVTHIAVINDEKGFRFDKIDLEWKQAVFVVIFRRNLEKFGQVEFLLPLEKRILLKNEEGERGKVFLRNIVQGLPKENEDFEKAALRETKEEVGELDLISLTKLEDIYFDPANSSVAMPFFLAEVKHVPATYVQQLDVSESIEVGEDDWFSVEDIPALKLQCGKTLSGIMLATGYLGLWNRK